MRILYVYYSLTAVTQSVVDILAHETGGDREAICDCLERRGMYWHTRSYLEGLSKSRPYILPLLSHVENYDFVVVGTPIWAGKISSPINTFLSGYGGKIKRYALLVTHGNKNKDYSHVVQDAATICGLRPETVFSISSYEVRNGQFDPVISFSQKLKSLI